MSRRRTGAWNIPVIHTIVATSFPAPILMGHGSCLLFVRNEKRRGWRKGRPDQSGASSVTGETSYRAEAAELGLGGRPLSATIRAGAVCASTRPAHDWCGSLTHRHA